MESLQPQLALIQTVKMAWEREECWFMRVAVVTRHLMPSRKRLAQCPIVCTLCIVKSAENQNDSTNYSTIIP